MINKLLILFLLFASLFIQAQEPVCIHFSDKDGLPDKELYNIIEDSKGFIWICANKGLYRYDGKKIKKYTNPSQRGLSVFGVQEDETGRIWCNNISGQFFYIENDKLHLFKDLSEILKGELAIFFVANEFLYVFSEKLIFLIDLKTKSIVKQLENKLYFGKPYKKGNTIYFTQLDSISCITPENKFENLFQTNLFKDYNKLTIFNIDTSNFLHGINYATNTFFKFNITNKQINKIDGFKEVEKVRIYNAFENENEVWLATNVGVWVYEFLGNRFELKKRFFRDKKITKILKDKESNYWFTTLNNGAFVIPNIYIEKSSISDLYKNIKCLDKINDTTLVFGTAKGNIAFYNTTSHSLKTVELPTENRVSSIKYHPLINSVVISKDFNGYTINVQTLEITDLNSYYTIKSFLNLDNKDLLYTDNRNVKLVKDVNFKSKNIPISLNRRTYTSYYNEIKKEVIVAFVDDLVVYDSSWNPKTIRYHNKMISGKSITQTSDSMVWVATFKNGIFGIKNGSVKRHYTTKNGLISNSIEKIKAEQNKLWIAQDNSLQLLDLLTNEIKTLTKRDGILSYNISGIEIMNNKVFFSSDEGLFSINKEKAFKTQNLEVYFNKIEINEKDTLITSNYIFDYNQNAIKIGFNVNGFLFNQKGRYKYRLKGFRDKWIVTEIGKNEVKYNSLPAGKYTFQVQPILNNETKENKMKEFSFIIKKPFWETWWFVLVVLSLLITSIILYYRSKIKKEKQQKLIEVKQLSLEKELISTNLIALRSQMNPHFIFNSLNSIQDLILKKETELSYDYIVLFSELIRNTLSYSNQDFISIDNELNFLKVYLKLEKLRFGEEFNYTISNFSKEDLQIPSLLLQPFIENALVHGLLHKKGNKELQIVFNYEKNTLKCIITDNGIGRIKASEIRNRQGKHHESFALNAIEKRLEIFKKQYDKNIGYVIEDLYENGISTGTKVIITMPFK